jgi:hypothetical protein
MAPARPALRATKFSSRRSKKEKVGGLLAGFGDQIDGAAIAADFLLARIAREDATPWKLYNVEAIGSFG